MSKRIIHVSVAEVKLPLHVSVQNAQEEEVFRLAAKLINKRMQEYQFKFSDKKKNDILAMVLLEFAKEMILEKHKKEVLIDEETIERINQQLDQVINN